MADYYTTLTTKGVEKVGAAINGGPALQLATMVAGDGNGQSFYSDFSKDQLKRRTKLVNQRWSGELNTVDQDNSNPNWVITEALVPTQVGGWYIREVGVVDVDGDLIAIGVYPETYKPVSTAVETDLLIRVIIEIGDADNVELKIDPSQVFATRAWVINVAIPHAMERLDRAVEEAETARDIAQFAVGIFPDVDQALANTKDGEYFWVPSAENTNLISLYQKTDGRAKYIKSYPSTHAVELAMDIASQPDVMAGEFHGENESDYNYLMIDEKEKILIGINSEGFHSFVGFPVADKAKKQSDIAISRSFQPPDIAGEFHTADNDPSFALIDETGNPLASWNSEGQQYKEDPYRETVDTPLIPYLSGNNLHAVGTDDVIAANLGQYKALSVTPGGSTYVRAVLDWPAISKTRSVAASNGYLIPDNDRILHVVIGIGQSLMVGAHSASSLVSTHPVWPDDALMFNSGDYSDVRMGLPTQGKQQSLNVDQLMGFRPLIARTGNGPGERGETIMESNAATLAQQARDCGIRWRSLSFTAAQGGTDYEGLKKGTVVYNNMLEAIQKAIDLAAENGWRVIVDGCVLKHGEADTGNDSYADSLLQWQADIDKDVKKITGQYADVHFIMSQPSSFKGGTEAIKAMLKLHNESPVHHLSGPDYPFGELYYADFLHMTGPGYHLIGEQTARAWKQALWSSKGNSQITQIIGAKRSNKLVTLTYEVPKPPLVFDTQTVSERDVKGFRFIDERGDIEISNVEITNDGQGTGIGEITLKLNSEPTGNDEAVLYAISGQSSDRNSEHIPRGNVRDSATEISDYDARPLYNWAVHQEFKL